MMDADDLRYIADRQNERKSNLTQMIHKAIEHAAHGGRYAYLFTIDRSISRKDIEIIKEVFKKKKFKVAEYVNPQNESQLYLSWRK